jgi:hypothetical protein
MKWLFINMWYLATGDTLIKPYIEGGGYHEEVN